MTAAVNPTGLMPVLAAAGSSLIEPVLSSILQSAPAPLPDIAVGTTPDFTAAASLAAVVGADPGRLLTASHHLSTDRGEIEAVIGEAIPLINRAAASIIATGQQFLAVAAPLLPGILAGPAGFNAILQVTALAGGALADAAKHLEELRAGLEPLIERLNDLASAAGERAPLVPSPSAHAAGEELRAMTAASAVLQPAALEPAGAVEPVEAAAPAAPAPPPSAGGSEAGHAAVAAAKSMVGTPYVWGGNSPGGFDCSGLTSWAYSQAGVDIPRTAESQATGRQVSYEELQPGDLVVWSGHVAMYAGDGMMVEAGDPVQMNPVRTSNIGMPFKGFWRPTA